MLDPTWCVRPDSQWLVLKTMIMDWLKTPAVVLVPLTVTIGLPWFIPRLRWKRHLMRVGILFFLISLIITSPLTAAIANKGLVAFLPKDSGVPVDAIVVLGRGDGLRQSRVDVAAELWKANRAPLIFVSGISDAPDIIHRLQEEGIPQSALAYEECSRTTEENARFTASVLKPQGVKTIVLVTDPPHMLRSLLTFRHFGFKVFPSISPVPSEVTPTRKRLMLLYEYLALIAYGFQGRLFPQP
jgi:uncharacterized SAM-binding protein YcdF (DUF218 family)